MAQFSYNTNEMKAKNRQQVDVWFSWMNVSFLLYFLRFVVDVFDVVFLYFLNAKIRISHIFLKKILTD